MHLTETEGQTQGGLLEVMTTKSKELLDLGVITFHFPQKRVLRDSD